MEKKEKENIAITEELLTEAEFEKIDDMIPWYDYNELSPEEQADIDSWWEY